MSLHPGYLLDTNVLSELMRPMPEGQVVAWFERHVSHPIWTSAVTQAEILTGIALLPEGKRRDALARTAEQLFEEDMAGRCLPFDAPAAKHYALLVAQRQRQGLPISTEDGQIAAIALASGLCVLTRNAKDFTGIEGLTVVNPWQAH